MAQRWDFFISYTTADQGWAEWIAWQLEDAGYQTLFQAWDFVPGSHWTSRMGEGIQHAERTMAILSHTYLTSVYGQHEWEAALRADPHGFARKLIPVRVEECPRPGLLGGVVSFDLFGHEPDAARDHLLRSITTVMVGRAKPVVAPAFPAPAAAPAVSAGLIPPDQPSRPPVPVFPDSTATRPLPVITGPPTPAAPRQVRRPHSPTTLSTLTGHTDRVSGVAFAPDSATLATASGDKTVRLWDVTDPTQPCHLSTLTGHTDRVSGVAFAPDGATLATASGDKTVRLWDVTDPTQPCHLSTRPGRIAILTGRAGPVNGVAFAHDGVTMATAGPEETVWLWDVADRARPRYLATLSTLSPFGNVPGFPGATGFVLGVAFAPDRATLAAVVGDETLWLWDVTDRLRPRNLAILTGQTGPVNGVAFAPNRAILATTSSDETVWLWDIADPTKSRHLTTLTGHTSFVKGVAFAPDGATLATASWDKTVRLWDIADPTQPRHLTTLTGHTSNVEEVAFAPDGATLATASWDKTVRLWAIS